MGGIALLGCLSIFLLKQATLTQFIRAWVISRKLSNYATVGPTPSAARVGNDGDNGSLMIPRFNAYRVSNLNL